jgi:NADH-quinone oxidoreductase subunit H
MVEYSGMKFAMFFIAEYVNMFAAAIVVATLFLGGYRFFRLEEIAPVLAPVIVFAKATFVIFCMLWFRATFPRLRFDHLVGFAWKFLVPLTLVNLMLAAFVVKVTPNEWIQAGLMLAGNIVLIAVTFYIVNRSARNMEDAPALKQIAAAER